ncbi:hypothetical protein D9758_002032 [Tetrapyrgos nigripes]|uniref:ubiquitinyl hydrolase 1 n=1 Tax=Tetrapyrgos nigripes TaxID=182062 RepID=A0A8H5GTE9_9AGAR|nr:hypothetical protein D9758_002032 [Tetrapyrgos nigripes]
MDDLIALIYHEKQQAGSMLCAQHALNSLLQGHYFTAPDLSEIALQLDQLEENYDNDHQPGSSSNMDDTGMPFSSHWISIFNGDKGFFSVQVLENALQVWGLSLVRWRGEEMRPFQEHPHTQLAFILNHEQHWYTLRRFGPALSNFRNDPGHGHWFNLNSFLSKPEWVGRLYLSMFLHQAESEGYSVFVVTQTDETSPLALPRTEADDVAATLLEPSSASKGTSSALNTEDLEDDDWELQAALQASLQHTDDDSTHSGPPPRRTSIPLPSTDIGATASSSHLEPPSIAESDFGAASRRMLQRMQAEQEYAQRELWNGNPRPADDDDEILRRVLAESEAMVNAEPTQRSTAGQDIEVDPGMDMDTPIRQSGGHPSILSGASERNYDDEDAELQAALKASLEDMPSAWPVSEPSTAGVTMPDNITNTTTLSSTIPASVSVASEDIDDADMESSGPSEAPDIEEMRKRRLARFGS